MGHRGDVACEYAVRKWIRVEMGRHGLVWDSWGARVDVSTLFDLAVAESSQKNGSPNCHLQILADGVRVYHSTMMTNVGVRAFDSCELYNSMAALKLL